MSIPIYNTIGSGYNTTRSADPYIAGRMMALLQPSQSGQQYIDVGCGTGNYLQFFTQAGYKFCGIDPSSVMLDVARERCPQIPIMQASAEAIPFDNHYFDGATAMFTLHHWTNQQAGLNELARVIKPDGRAVFLSFTAAQMAGYWLSHYFPEMIRNSGTTIPDEPEMINMLHQSGFQEVTTEKYFVQDGLQDHFLYSNKNHPEQYLNPEIRKGISSFAAFATLDEVEKGLQQLEADISDGTIRSVIASYENDMGDYLFYVATKR